MNLGADSGTSLGASIGNSLSSEKPKPGGSWLFFVWPIRDRLSDI